MSIQLPSAKKQRIRGMCETLLNNGQDKTRQIAKVLGTMVATFPGVRFGPLHYRTLEREKMENVQAHKGSYDGHMSLSDGTRNEIQWWCDNISNALTYIRKQNPTLWMCTDASFSGWGGVLEGAGVQKSKTSGTWSEDEAKSENINFLELKAVHLSLMALCTVAGQTTIAVQVDNAAAVAAINRMGSRSLICNAVVQDIWRWANDRAIWLTVAHIAGVDNVEADAESRQKHAHEFEWSISARLFDGIVATIG